MPKKLILWADDEKIVLNSLREQLKRAMGNTRLTGSGDNPLADEAVRRFFSEKQNQGQTKKQGKTEPIAARCPVTVFLWKNEAGWPVEYVSENVSRFGYTVADFIQGKLSYTGIIHPDDFMQMIREVEACSGKEVKGFRQEYRILTRSRQVRWAVACICIRRDEKENITHYQGIVMDITAVREKSFSSFPPR